MTKEQHRELLDEDATLALKATDVPNSFFEELTKPKEKKDGTKPKLREDRETVLDNKSKGLETISIADEEACKKLMASHEDDLMLVLGE